MTARHDCPLCRDTAEHVLWRGDRLRVISVDDGLYPGYTRVIWQDHVREMTDLQPCHRDELMNTVWHVEQTLRHCMRPDKVNLAQFGNMAPHLHWHVIPRWQSDSHFPDAVWAPPPSRTMAQDTAWGGQRAQLQARIPDYHQALVAALEQAAS